MVAARSPALVEKGKAQSLANSESAFAGVCTSMTLRPLARQQRPRPGPADTPRTTTSSLSTSAVYLRLPEVPLIAYASSKS